MNISHFLYLYLLTIILYIILVYIRVIAKESKNCISLIVPSTERDFFKCHKQFFYYSKSFTIAKEIVIAISSVTNTTKIERIIDNISFRKKIILGIRKSNHNAASNRNYGFLLSKCNYISFFDIDDVMSINRLPLLYNLLVNDKTTEFILHKYSSTCNKMSYKITHSFYKYKYNLSYKYIYESYRKNYKREKSNTEWCCKYIKEIKMESIHNGWPTMRRYIMKKIKYNLSYWYGQDVDFNSNVILSGYNTSILNISLGYYKKDNSCRNYRICI